MQNLDNKKMKEIWKHINGYEDYMVSNLGRVKSLKRGKEKILVPLPNGKGYYKVCLWRNGSQKSFKIHRLVAEAFLDNPNNLPIINHRDENKQNNAVSNLEWCNEKYNHIYSCSKKVGCYSNGKLIKIYDVMRDAEKDGFKKSAICNCCKRKLNKHHGYQWAYIN